MTTVHNLQPAVRALDIKQIQEHGPIGAIIKAPTAKTARRRAALALGQHWDGHRKVAPGEVVLALLTWSSTHETA